MESDTGQTLLERAFLLGLCASISVGFFEMALKSIFYSPTIEGIISWHIGWVIASGVVGFFVINYFDGFPIWEVKDLFIFIIVYGIALIPIMVLTDHLFKRDQKGNFDENLSYIIVKGKNANEELVVDPREIMFIMSEDDSIRIFYLEHGEIISKLISKSLEGFMREYADLPFLERCHKSYLINIEQISEVVRDKQQIFLHYSSEYIIPVEEKFRNKVLERISK